MPDPSLILGGADPRPRPSTEPGAAPDPNEPALAQDRATTLVGRWSGLWLRARLRADPVARTLIEVFRGSVDGTVRVRTD